MNEQEKEEVLRKCLTPGALQYLNFIKQAKPNIYDIIRNDIYFHYMNGRITKRIGAERIKYIIREVSKKLKMQSLVSPKRYGRVVA